MLGIKELKDKIEITKTAVECPVKGCSEKVKGNIGFLKKKIDSDVRNITSLSLPRPLNIPTN